MYGGWGNRTPKKIKKKKHGATTKRGINIVWSENNGNARTGGGDKILFRSALTFKLLESYSLFHYELCENKIITRFVTIYPFDAPINQQIGIGPIHPHTHRHTEGNYDKKFDEFQTTVLFQSLESKQNLAPVFFIFKSNFFGNDSIFGPRTGTFDICHLVTHIHTDTQHLSHLQTRSSTQTRRHSGNQGHLKPSLGGGALRATPSAQFSSIGSRKKTF